MASQRRKAAPESKADQEFVSEAEEILERMRGDLTDLSERGSEDGEPDPDLVNRLFRSAHSLKGLAGLFGFDPIRDLAHHLEDVLDGMRLGRVRLDSPGVMLINESARLFGMLLEQVGDADAMVSSETLIQDLAGRIQALAQAASAARDELAELDVDSSLLRALTEYEEHRLRENLNRGRHILLVDSTFEIISFEEGLGALTAAIREIGEVISTLPAPGDAPESQIRFSVLAASELAADSLGARLDVPNASVREIGRGVRAAAVTRTSAPEAEGSAPIAAGAVPAAPEIESLKSISDTVRVDIRKLDELMNLVGELVIQRGAIGELVTRLGADPATARLGKDLANVYKVLDRKLQGLQAAVLDARMVPLRQVFEKVSRVVRGLRRDLGKDARLEVRGADTELDKLIVEELVDPLMHAVRNAFDHAIEPAEERVAAGKDPQGCIRIEAFQRGNHVVIAVSDDGAGIDVAALRARAEETGVVQAGDSLNERQTLELIFEPGLSTRGEVTETSGRGVGMDVVRNNVTALGGIVDVDSIPGRGTTISMTLPITLAIIQSLIVMAGGQRFAIPLNAVLETILIDPGDIQRSDGRELLHLRGEALPLRRLAAEFGLSTLPDETKQFVVVLGLGDVRIGLVVSRLDGQQDTVIKAIQGPVQSMRGIAGATELGDQDPVLVLDVAAIAEDARRRRETA